MGIAADLLTVPTLERRAWVARQDPATQALVIRATADALGTPYGLYIDDPVGFVEDVLGEMLWSRQVAIAETIRDNKRVSVPACHAPGKSHTAARLIVWWVCVHRPEDTMVLSTARSFGQVRKVLWPHIRRLHKRHTLPGVCNQTEWQIEEAVVASGIKPADHDETGIQGFHQPHLLIVVDESGGISDVLGDNLNSIMTGGDSHLLAIGNPPTDGEGGWFERIAQSDLWVNLPIPAFATPNFTGEAIPPEVAVNLVDQTWVDEIRHEFGEDSAYYIARVLAQFPKISARRAIPVLWFEQACENETPAQSRWQRLGVDVADGGGDEMVVARADGWDVSILDTWARADAADQVVNAERVLEHIQFCETVQTRDKFTDRPVRVKIDAIGVGAGTADILTKMGRDGRHNAVIVHVHVSNSPKDSGRYRSQRDEAWWNLRELCRDGTIRLTGMTEKDTAQFTNPLYENDSAGRIVIESKKNMKKRGLRSPDHADAVCLAVYEPESVAVAVTHQPDPDLSGRVGSARSR